MERGWRGFEEICQHLNSQNPISLQTGRVQRTAEMNPRWNQHQSWCPYQRDQRSHPQLQHSHKDTCIIKNLEIYNTLMQQQCIKDFSYILKWLQPRWLAH